MKKLLFSIIVFILAGLAAISLISAEEITVNGSCPTKLVYDKGTKTMTITYVGDGVGWYEFMPVYQKDDGSYNYDVQNFMDKYRTEVEHIEIGRFKKIQLAPINDANKNLVDGAKLFYGMTALKSVHFAVDQRILMGHDKYGIFEGCTALTTVWFGSDSNKIEGCANFTGCNTNENDNGKGLNLFPKNLFKGCSSLKSVIYTANPNESVIYSSTFEGCTSLESIKIGDNIKQVAKEAFEKYKFIDLEDGTDITTPLPEPDPEAPEVTPGQNDSGKPPVTPEKINAEEIIVNGSCPTKLVYDEGTKTMTITYVGDGVGWYEFMPVFPKNDGSYNYDVQNFMDKYRTEVEHIEIGRFKKIQLAPINDANNSLVDGAKLFYGMTALKSVHFAVDQRILMGHDKYGIFEGCTALTTVWFGSDSNKIEGCANFKGCNTKDDDNGKGLNLFSRKLFKGCSSLKSVIYTANINESVIYSSTFEGCTSLESIKIGNNIKQVAKEAFEKYKFIDFEDGTDITTPLPEPDPEAPAVTPVGTPEDFNPEGATIFGYSYGEYNEKTVIDTYWAYYDDTKTLEFTSFKTTYNETGALSNCVDTNWSEYTDVIEHIIVGDNIAKVTGSAFMNYPSLKDVRLGKQVKQIDNFTFDNCKNLTTIWRDGKERIEGRADFRGFTRFTDCLVGTSVSEIVMPENPSTLDVNMPMTVVNVYSTNITEELKAHAEFNLYNLINLNNPSEKYEHYVYIDPTLPLCGRRAAFSFDEASGTLTVHGAGPIDDIVNYHGGGSKNQPWFSIKKQIKHIILSENITSIGKYAFAECENVETVQLPSREDFIINAAAFEGCFNMKSVYIEGSEPIEGTIDVRNVPVLESWTFAYNYLIANVVINPSVEKIGNSVFSDNLNLANIYGTPGSFAEEYASKIGGTFYDISSSSPQPIKCEPPETTAKETESKQPENTTTPESAFESTPEAETEKNNRWGNYVFIKTDAEIQTDTTETPWAIIIGAISAFLAFCAIASVILIVKKKKNNKNN